MAVKKKAGLTWLEVQKLAAEFPGVVLSTSYGTPALKANKKLITRLSTRQRYTN